MHQITLGRDIEEHFNLKLEATHLAYVVKADLRGTQDMLRLATVLFSELDFKRLSMH